MSVALYTTPKAVQEVLTRNEADPVDVEGNAASTDEQDVIEKNIVRAGSEIDSKLGSKYTVPFSPVPPLIEMITVAIAAYYSDLTYRESRDYATNLNPVYLRYQDAEALLLQLQQGTAVIPPDGTTPVDPTLGSGSIVVQTITRPPLFGPCDFDIYGCGVSAAPYWTADGWGQG
jgi:phage gp36-like protein